MTTNITIFAVDGPAVIYLQDGSALTVDAGEEKFIQLPEAHMLTISDTPAPSALEESAESPPPGYAFAQAMVEFWQRAMANLQPEATPL